MCFVEERTRRRSREWEASKNRTAEGSGAIPTLRAHLRRAPPPIWASTPNPPGAPRARRSKWGSRRGGARRRRSTRSASARSRQWSREPAPWIETLPSELVANRGQDARRDGSRDSRGGEREERGSEGGRDGEKKENEERRLRADERERKFGGRSGISDSRRRG